MTCLRPNVARSDPRSVAELAEPLRSRIAQAITDAPGRGLVLVSGYRDSGRQWDLRHERCPGRECSTACKGYPVTARPGTSKHEKRLAADMGGAALSWLIAHREAYGLALTVASENWHFEAGARDTRTGRVHNRPTVAIRPFGGDVVQPIDPNAGRVWRPFKSPATDGSIYAAGGHRFEVSELQIRLRVPVDGIYGAATVAAWVAWQAAQHEAYPLDPRWLPSSRNSAVTADKIAALRKATAAPPP